MADMAMPEFDEAPHGQAHALAIVRRDGGQPPLRVGAVDQHGRQAELEAADDDRITRVRRGEDQTLHATRHKAVHQLQPAFVVARMGDENGSARIAPNVRRSLAAAIAVRPLLKASSRSTAASPASRL